MRRLTIAIDGACLGNPGDGGWGMVAVGDDVELTRLSGFQFDTTNNRMEMQAAIEACKYLRSIGNQINEETEIEFLTDSQYVQKGITEWIHGWKKSGWKGSNKKPVKNQDLWMELDLLNQSSGPIKWSWVRGHNGHPLNEIADELANEAAGIERTLLSPPSADDLLQSIDL